MIKTNFQARNFGGNSPRKAPFDQQTPCEDKGEGLAPEPIAIIGIGCRFPGGVEDCAGYWNLLTSGRDAISVTPSDRWSLEKFFAPGSAKPSKTQSRWGGYVDDLEHFDPQLFGISPREAASIDPQHRLLLEVSYRALEDAGVPVDQVAGDPVAVFVGISSFDYAVAGISFQDRGVLNAYSNTGGSSSIAANRISYCFDLRGPSVAVDTACSSSLVAVHMACQSIWRGESPLALAGGVNALILPDFYVAFSQLGVLSPDGRCKSFAADANGYVRSEGAGMVLLKPLKLAIQDGDPVYSVIRATALNQDGRTPGMTVPSQAAQEALLRSACRLASIHPSNISYVEAHGTGTPVGDPIEAAALGAVLGEGRSPDHPCVLGSVKANIGHLEAGAGIASVIKVALALRHRQIPAQLNFSSPNPNIDFDRLKLQVPLDTMPWASPSEPRLAGINGFGYGGANAHVIMQEAPAHTLSSLPLPATSGDERLRGDEKTNGTAGVRRPLDDRSAEAGSPEDRLGQSHKAPRVVAPNGAPISAKNGNSTPFVAPVILPLSARSPAALKEQAEAMADWLEDNEQYHLPEIASYLALRRSHHEYRASVCATTKTELTDALRNLAGSPESTSTRDVGASNPQIAFVCSGQGPQWWAMGRRLLKYSPVFREVIRQCDTEMRQYAPWSLLEEMTRNEGDSRLQRTSIAQPAIFALQVALARVWAAWGIVPDIVVGHSVGEIAAAHLCGALDFEDACSVAFHRGRTMDLASSQGAMLSVGLSTEKILPWLDGLESQVSLAAINSPHSLTLSGEAHAIEELANQLEQHGVFCRRLQVEYAFHSPQMEPVRAALLSSLGHIQPRKPHTPLASTVTGKLIADEQLDAEYWWCNVRQPVRFQDAICALSEQDIALAVEVGPHPVMAYSINECYQSLGKSIRTVPSLHRQQDDLKCISRGLADLYSLGCNVRWAGFYRKPEQKIPIPNYPFQRQPCWSESHESRITRLSSSVHPLLGESTFQPAPQWQQRIDLKLQDYLAHHKVRGTCFYPAAAMIETAISAASQMNEIEFVGNENGERTGAVRLERFQLHNPCMLTEERPKRITTTYAADTRKLHLTVRDHDADRWSELASVTISSDSSLPSQTDGSSEAYLESVRARCDEEVCSEQLYQFCHEAGLTYGPEFRGVMGGCGRDGEALMDVELSATLDNPECLRGYIFHPALLDSCFHTMVATDPSFDLEITGLYLPHSIAEITLHRRPSSRLRVHARLLCKTSKKLVCDLDIYDDQSRLCATIRQFESRCVNRVVKEETVEDLVYSYSWVEQALKLPIETDDQRLAFHPCKNFLLFMDHMGIGRALAAELREQGCNVQEVTRGSASQPQPNNQWFADPEDAGSFRKLLTAATEGAETTWHVVYLWGCDAVDNDCLDTQELDESTHLTTLAPLLLIQAWDQLEGAPQGKLTMLTAGAQSMDGQPESTAIAQGPLIGFGRVIVSEFGRLTSKLVDLPRQASAEDIAHLAQELLVFDDEDEVMWREGSRFVHRFLPQAEKLLTTEAVTTTPSRLSVGTTSASLDELCYRTCKSPDLLPGQLEIEVLAAGLNFSDVMKALSLYPGMPEGPVLLGAECAGRVSRIGPDCTWQVGDEVLAVAPGSFGTHVIANQALVARKPRNLSFEQAAALPIAFLTADYALNYCARLQPGESVLIHSASGGVGMAAMQLAKLGGLTIYATAGSEAKRETVRRLGARLIMDSRSLAFAHETLAATQGIGVDAVLNSLPGEAIAKGLSTLKPGGRFLEIGKRDIHSDTALGLFPFRNNLAMFAIDLEQLFEQQPALMGSMLENLVHRFESGELDAPPIEVYSSDEAVDAFRMMRQAKHVGKIVLSYEQRPVRIKSGELDSFKLKADATYWIAGGLGGFGLRIARWMVDRGARSLVVGGRSREISLEAQAEIDVLQERGARVSVMPADITRVEDVRAVLRSIESQLPPLRGIVHAAMILEDKLLVDLDEATLNRVLRPKLLGGWNLHQESLGLELDMFVLFSSLSSVFGHAGQANYSAANAMLDSLAYYRRAAGLPATVMNWGHLGEVGYLAEREQLGQRLERQGVLSFSVKQATDCLEYALQTKAVQLSVLRMDWSVWRGLGITNRVSPRFAHLLSQSQSDVGAVDLTASGLQFPGVVALRNAALTEQSRVIERMLGSKLSLLMGIPAEKIPLDRNLLELGLDSLMAVEMRNWLESLLEINFPISSLMGGENIKQLTELVLGVFNKADEKELPAAAEEAAAPTSETIPDTQAENLLRQLPNLGSEDVSRLLGQLLREQ